MQNRGIKTVVLDWSGTVSDDRRLVWTANMAILRHYGLKEIPFEEFIPRVQMTVAEMAKIFGITDDPTAINKLYKDNLVLAKSNGLTPRPYPGAEATLSHLKSIGVTVAILSSHPSIHLEEEAELFGLRHLLTNLTGDSSDKVAGLHQIMQGLGADKTRLLYVGDTVFDVRAAKEAGVVSGAILTGYHTRERLEAEQPDYLFSSLSDIRGVVRSIPV